MSAVVSSSTATTDLPFLLLSCHTSFVSFSPPMCVNLCHYCFCYCYFCCYAPFRFLPPCVSICVTATSVTTTTVFFFLFRFVLFFVSPFLPCGVVCDVCACVFAFLRCGVVCVACV